MSGRSGSGRRRLELRELTARGPGAVSVIELGGADLDQVLAELCGCGRPAPGRIRRVRVRLGGSDSDEALLVGRTDQRVELHLHGSPILVAELLAELDAPPEVRDPLAAASLEQRAEQRLLACAGEEGARILLEQVQGALRSELEELARQEAEGARAGLARLAQRYDRFRLALEPARIVLAGPVNAGKSTLFNLLFGRTRVVTHATAGTTRDAVRELVTWNGFALELWDTAGERAAGELGPEDELEREALERARELREGADLVMWLEPWDSEPAPIPPAGRASSSLRWLRLATRDDGLAAALPWPSVSCAVHPALALETVWAELERALALERARWPGRLAVPPDGALAAQLAQLASDPSRGQPAGGLQRLLEQGRTALAPGPPSPG
jgi:hypothetical protein